MPSLKPSKPEAEPITPAGSPKELPAGLKLTSRLVPRGAWIWTVEGRLPMFTICEIPVRMTILGLPKKNQSPNKKGQLVDLLLYSPLYPTKEILTDIKALGSVKFIVTPNVMHHIWSAEWKSAFPNAKVIAPAALKAKRPDLAVDVVAPALPAGWPSEVASLHTLPLVDDEVVIVHKPSRSLVVADLAFNFESGGETPLPSGTPVTAYLYLTGGYKPCTLTSPFKWLIKDAALTKTALEELVKVDWDQLIMAHGSVVPKGAKEPFKAGTLSFVSQLSKEQADIKAGKGLLGFACSVQAQVTKLALPKLPNVQGTVQGLQEHVHKHPYAVAGGLAAATVVGFAVLASGRKC